MSAASDRTFSHGTDMTVMHARGFSAFRSNERIASGSLVDVALATRSALAGDPGTSILVFDDSTGRPLDLDVRGTAEEVRARVEILAEAWAGPTTTEAAESPRRGPGRPRLGVVSREVTLLPRHWAWLAAQRGGASATLRRLVEQARKAGGRHEAVRKAQDAAYRFMSALAGDLPGYEEAIRALFAGDAEKFARETRGWPGDVRDHSARLAAEAFSAPSSGPSAE